MSAAHIAQLLSGKPRKLGLFPARPEGERGARCLSCCLQEGPKTAVVGELPWLGLRCLCLPSSHPTQLVSSHRELRVLTKAVAPCFPSTRRTCWYQCSQKHLSCSCWLWPRERRAQTSQLGSERVPSQRWGRARGTCGEGAAKLVLFDHGGSRSCHHKFKR